MWSPAIPVPSERDLEALANTTARVKRAVFAFLETLPQPLVDAIRLEVCRTLEVRIKTVQTGQPHVMTTDEEEVFEKVSDHVGELMDQVVIPISLEEGADDGSLVVYKLSTTLHTVPGVYEEAVVAVDLVQFTPGGDIMDEYEVFVNVNLLTGSIALDTGRFHIAVQDGREYH